jgi:hypothetical protein
LLRNNINTKKGGYLLLKREHVLGTECCGAFVHTHTHTHTQNEKDFKERKKGNVMWVAEVETENKTWQTASLGPPL